MERNASRIKPVYFAIALGIVPVIAITRIRFFPATDYAQWIYLAHVLDNFSDYNNWFYINALPIPNLGSTLFLWPLTKLFGAETAGRVLGSLYGFATIVAFYYLVRGLDRRSGLLFIGPIFVFNFFFLAGTLSFYLGLPILLLTLGVLVRTEEITLRSWSKLTLLSTLAYFCHLFAWLPVLIYVLIRALLSYITGRRSMAAKLCTTQLLPLSLFLIYAALVLFAGRGVSDGIRYYFSLSEKLFSMIAPVLPFFRLDPFPPPLPVAVLNGVFILIILLTAIIAFRHFSVDKEIPSASLGILSIVFLLIAILLPVYVFRIGWFDSRFAFLGFILFTAYLGKYIPSRFQLPFAIVALAIIILQSLMLQANDYNLRMIYKASQAREVGASLYVASFKQPPLRGACNPQPLSVGPGIFSVEALHFFDIVERDHLYASAFNQALLRNYPGSKPAIIMGFFPTAADRDTLVNKALTGQLQDFDYLVVYGCPSAIDQVSSIWQGGPGTLVNESDYHRLIRLR